MNVSWDDSSQLNGQIKNVPNHQPGMMYNLIWGLYPTKHDGEKPSTYGALTRKLR
jgi:hypothetical protein